MSEWDFARRFEFRGARRISSRSVLLVVEVDGGYHAERATADARRSRVLERLGYRVLRVLASSLATTQPSIK